MWHPSLTDDRLQPEPMPFVLVDEFEQAGVVVARYGLDTQTQVEAQPVGHRGDVGERGLGEALASVIRRPTPRNCPEPQGGVVSAGHATYTGVGPAPA